MFSRGMYIARGERFEGNMQLCFPEGCILPEAKGNIHPERKNNCIMAEKPLQYFHYYMMKMSSTVPKVCMPGSMATVRMV